MTNAPTTMESQRRLADAQFERVLRERDLQTLFQPIVHLPSGAIVGYEALTRGPEGSAVSSAGALLAAANRAGRLTEFDWAARACACAAALDARLDPDLLLFLNIEPIALDSECPPDLWPVIERGFQTFRVVLEVTERSLDRDPGTLLDGVERKRPVVDGIALDDVGDHPATVAMLPLVAPAIVKIDRSVVQSPPNAKVARVLNAVLGQIDKTGAMVLAEGVETAEHRRQAIAYGAELAQGNLLGQAGPLPRGGAEHGPAGSGVRGSGVRGSGVRGSGERGPAGSGVRGSGVRGPGVRGSGERGRVIALSRTAPLVVASPFEVLADHAVGPADADLVGQLIRYVGACADVLEPTLHVLLMAGDRLDSAELDRLARLASSDTFVAVLGPGVPPEPGRGIRGTGQRSEPLPTAEWAAITVSPGLCVAVVARPAPGPDGAWEYGITNDWPRTIAATRSLVRLLGAPEPRFRFMD